MDPSNPSSESPYWPNEDESDDGGADSADQMLTNNVKDERTSHSRKRPREDETLAEDTPSAQRPRLSHLHREVNQKVGIGGAAVAPAAAAISSSTSTPRIVTSSSVSHLPTSFITPFAESSSPMNTFTSVAALLQQRPSPSLSLGSSLGLSSPPLSSSASTATTIPLSSHPKLTPVLTTDASLASAVSLSTCNAVTLPTGLTRSSSMPSEPATVPSSAASTTSVVSDEEAMALTTATTTTAVTISHHTTIPSSIDPTRYKTMLCRSWQKTGKCRYEGVCQFAHGEAELRPVARTVRPTPSIPTPSMGSSSSSLSSASSSTSIPVVATTSASLVPAPTVSAAAAAAAPDGVDYMKTTHLRTGKRPHVAMCFNCWSDEHTVDRCPHELWCSKCGATGHTAQVCATIKKGGVTIGHCFNCGSSEHSLKQCPRPLFCTTCKRPGHTSNVCFLENEAAKREKMKNKEQTPAKPTTAGDTMEGAQPPQKRPPIPVEQIVCFNCKEVGHTAKNCQKVLVCTICGETGHTANKCKSCHNCGGNHILAKCPLPRHCTKCGRQGHTANICKAELFAKRKQEQSQQLQSPNMGPTTSPVETMGAPMEDVVYGSSSGQGRPSHHVDVVGVSPPITQNNRPTGLSEPGDIEPVYAPQ